MSTVINMLFRGPPLIRCFSMSRITCADLGADCPFEAKGMDKKLVKEEFMHHLNEHHKHLVESMTEEELKEAEKKIDE